MITTSTHLKRQLLVLFDQGAVESSIHPPIYHLLFRPPTWVWYHSPAHKAALHDTPRGALYTCFVHRSVEFIVLYHITVTHWWWNPPLISLICSTPLQHSTVTEATARWVSSSNCDTLMETHTETQHNVETFQDLNLTSVSMLHSVD